MIRFMSNISFANDILHITWKIDKIPLASSFKDINVLNSLKLQFMYTKLLFSFLMVSFIALLAISCGSEGVKRTSLRLM